MIVLEGRVSVKSRPRDIFERFCGWADWPKWWSALEGLAPAAGELTEGAEFSCALRPHKMARRFSGRVARLEPGRAVGLALTRPGLRLEMDWTFSGEKDGCLVAETVRLSGPGVILYRLQGQVEALAHMVKRNLNGFKNYCEKDRDDIEGPATGEEA